jgi:hypothetical protein
MDCFMTHWISWATRGYASHESRTRAEPRPSHPHVHSGEGMEKSKNIQEPQNYENDHDCIQDRLNGSCHGYEVINQPKENTNYDQNHEYVN